MHTMLVDAYKALFKSKKTKSGNTKNAASVLRV